MEDFIDTPRGTATGAKRQRLSKTTISLTESENPRDEGIVHANTQQQHCTVTFQSNGEPDIKLLEPTEVSDVVKKKSPAPCDPSPASVNFRTPVSKHKRPSSSTSSSSVNSSISSSQHSAEPMSVPKVNPFERHILANLHRPFWSPSIFPPNAEFLETPPQTTWEIDQMAVLFPKPIEDSPSTHQNELKLTPSTEAKAQADIETFFSQSCVLPSPAINPNESANALMGAMAISNSPHISALHSQKFTQSVQMFSRTAKKVTDTTDSWTSTRLSLPPDLPPHVEAVLKPFLRGDENLSSSLMCSNHISTSTTGNANSNKRNSILGPCLSLNSSTNGSSRRRRLAFSSADEDEDENQSCSQLDESYEELSPSPLQMSINSPMTMLTPCKTLTSPSLFNKDGFQIRRTEFTPNTTNNLSELHSPNLTPIRRPFPTSKPATAKMLDMSSSD